MNTHLFDFPDFPDVPGDSMGLSNHALAALNEFLTEQKQQESALSSLKAAKLQGNCSKNGKRSGLSSGADTPSTAISDGSTSEDKDDEEAVPAAEPNAVSMAMFKEDWQLSQFWYNDETAQKMSEELLQRAKGGLIACVSAPTVFLYLKNLGVPNPLLLLEIDTRFSVFPEFRLYDYTRPLDVEGIEEGGAIHGSAAAVLLDPPFLNEDCLSKSADTIKALSGPDTSILISSGWSVRGIISQKLSARITDFRPRHNGGLANAFRSYVNYVSDDPEFAFSTNPEDGDNDFEEEK